MGLGSTIFTNPEHASDVETASTKIRAVDSVFKELNLKNVDLMKINIEGAEFPLLEKMIECQLLGNVDCFMIQFHEWHPGAYRRRKAILKELSKTHKLVWDYNFIWEKWVRK
jgi:hypothetical protein